jgi:hypothetical protein
MSSIWEEKPFLLSHLEHLVREVETLRARIQPHDTGHIHTAIHVMENRIKEIGEALGN